MIRILVVDDMRTVFSMLSMMLGGQEDFEVVGWASNGREAVEMSRQLKPDLITMDVQMPVMNGLEATREIMANEPVPIVVVSTLASDQDANLTYSALDEGALAVLAKPVAPFDPQFEKMHRDLVDTVRTMAGVRLVRRQARRSHSTTRAVEGPRVTREPQAPVELVALGCSAGGPQVLHSILSRLPATFPVPIVVVQHITEGFVDGLVSWLDSQVPPRVKVAGEWEGLEAGTVYVGPDACQFTVARSGDALVARLVDSCPVGGFKPAVTVLLESVAGACGGNAIGAILSGMGMDGAAGLLSMRRVGARTFVQDEESALVYGMASSALELGAVGQVIDLDHIASHLLSSVAR